MWDYSYRDNKSLSDHLFFFFAEAQGCSINFPLFFIQINHAAYNELQCHWKDIHDIVHTSQIQTLQGTEQVLHNTD